MFLSLRSRLVRFFQIPTLLTILLLCANVTFGQAQSNAADIQGTVTDAAGAVVPSAIVTARNPSNNISRSATTNGEGLYRIINVPPGDYEITVEAPNFKKTVLPKITVTVGQAAEVDARLEPGQISESVTVSDATSEIIETSKTAVATTIDQQRINNLPINERNYINFSLINSTVGRDNGRPIGPAPTTGLNFGGQRGRSNLVQVDGADNTDNSVNASRSTVSQEAVQEFQVVTNSFAPEFGRSAGGVVNVVTKSGTNEFHGNMFGFLRHRSFQARNAFAPIEDPPFTRTQYGFTLGGPLDRDRTFFFFAFEQRRRNESGFFTSNVAQGLTGSVTLPPLAPGFPAQTLRNITPAQAAYINSLLAAGGSLAQLGIGYAYLASGGGSTALNGFNPLIATGAPFTPGAIIGSRFFLTGAPVPLSTVNSLGQPIAFRALRNLQPIFPITDRTTFNSFRLDHLITSQHQFSFRFGYNPSTITGIQVESQNQSLGQNDFSRTGIQKLRDFSAVATLTSTLSNSIVNEARFNFGERRATFKSQNGDAVAFNISGTAFIGRELFSPVLRTETRYEYTDNVNWVKGNHNFKFGVDAAFIRIPQAIFELNFAGLFNFGGLGACTLLAQLCALPPALNLPPAPDFTAVQQYGLGFPSNFIQGFGNPISSISNKPLAFFAQDSWKVRPNLTLNYGVRYDYELTEQVPTLPFRDPLSGINLSAADILAAQDAMGVQQGFPRDKNNWAPRLAIAWDPKNNGKTVIRAAFGMFYDHPLLAIAFNSDIADAVQQQQGILTPGSPAQTALLNAVQVFQGTVCPPGGPVTPICPAGVVTPGVAAGAQYQFGRQRFNDQTFPGFGPVLPFTLHVQKNFEYAYANQGNFTVERALTKDMSISGSYIFVGAHHLPHPLDINAPRTDLQIQNFFRFAGRNPVSTTEALAFSIPTSGAPCPFGV
ncbi:MAG TPA: TonB-dependent receptor, partial [Pyrinomonadaceae bacterium]|nr:TonB-dependent receptor [Pyrinomonadaceae bacterium]